MTTSICYFVFIVLFIFLSNNTINLSYHKNGHHFFFFLADKLVIIKLVKFVVLQEVKVLLSLDSREVLNVLSLCKYVPFYNSTSKK